MNTVDRNRAKILDATRYIERTLDASLRVSEIARQVHISPFHFQRLFFAYMGEPINQYITARRLERAATILVDRHETNLLHLALDCGFQTHSAFSRAFRNHFGISPSTFRKAPESARVGTDPNRPFLVSAPPTAAIEAADVIDLEAFHFQFREAFGTQDGQFFAGEEQDIAAQFSDLLAEDTPPDLFLMSCFPDTPQSLNDNDATVWFGGGFSRQTQSRWSKNWQTFRAGTWAVFEHRGDYSHLHQTWNRIYRNWLTQTDYQLRDDIPFEAYVGNANGSDQADQLTRIFIPVKKA